MPMTIIKRMRSVLPVVQLLIHPLIHYEVRVNAAMMNVHDDAGKLREKELALFNLDGPFSLKSASGNVCLQVSEKSNMEKYLDLQECDESSKSQTFVYRSDYKIQSVSKPLLCLHFSSSNDRGSMQYCLTGDESNFRLTFVSDGSIQQMKDRNKVVTTGKISAGSRLSLKKVNKRRPNSKQKWKVVLQRPPSYPPTLLHKVGQDTTLNTTTDGFGFGSSVSLSQNGNILAAGAPGLNCVTVYKLVRNENFGITRWEPLGQTIKGPIEGNNFGFSLQLSADGHTLVVGEPLYENEVGRVQVFSYNADSSENWIQLGNDIIGDMDDSSFGQSVTISGDGRRVAIGAPDYDIKHGRVFVHVYDDTDGGDGWGDGQQIAGRDSFFHGFGHDVSLSGDGSTLACSAPRAFKSGFVMVYKVNKDDKKKYGGRVIIKPESFLKDSYRFGWSISLSWDGSRIAVGSPDYPDPEGISDSLSQTGRADIYEPSDEVSGTNKYKWVPVGEPIFGSQVNGLQSGWSVSLSSSGNHVAIGAYRRNSFRGQVVVHEFINGSWGDDLAIDGQSDEEWFGYDVAFGGDTFLAVGAPGAPGASTKSGVVRAYEWR